MVSKLRFVKTREQAAFYWPALRLLLSPWFRKARPLQRAGLASDPQQQFEQWFQEARKCWSLEFPEACALATVGEDGYPETRMVLLKEVQQGAFVFFTNTQSKKGQDIEAHPKAGLLFYWAPFQRQVRIVGDVELLDEEHADAYFATRPRGSQVGAWASAQSSVLDTRQELLRKVQEVEARYIGQDIPRPPYWCGYRLIPRRFEFWQLRASRLHDRFQYLKNEANSWEIRRLSP